MAIEIRIRLLPPPRGPLLDARRGAGKPTPQTNNLYLYGWSPRRGSLARLGSPRWLDVSSAERAERRNGGAATAIEFPPFLS